MEAIYIMYLEALLNTDELIQLQTKLGLYKIIKNLFKLQLQLFSQPVSTPPSQISSARIRCESERYRTRKRDREREKGRCKKNNWELNIQQQIR